jgi:hypothetical protein
LQYEEEKEKLENQNEIAKRMIEERRESGKKTAKKKIYVGKD